MVSTRTSDGTIGRVNYGYSTSRHRDDTKTPDARRRGRRVRHPQGRVRVHPERLKESIPEPRREDVCDGVNFVPQTAFGELLVEGLSLIGHAQHKIAQWEIIREAHEKNLPHLLPQIDERMREARGLLRKLLDDPGGLEVNSSVVYKCPRRITRWFAKLYSNHEKRNKKVTDRVGVLEEALRTSKFTPEAENIQAAIDAYRNGDIPYSTQYTLIWNGTIVDRVDTYADFTTDRLARLDRYLEAFGPHWLWWESPLEVRPCNAPRQSRCCTLNRNIASHGLGSYYIVQAFWKRAHWVRRLPLGNFATLPPELPADFLTSEGGLIYCQSEGPRLAYESLLDSGATFPSLYTSDFHSLGIDANNYAAQTIESLETANGKVHARTYEMFVSPVDQSSMESLVDEDDAVWPYHAKYLGGLCPVTTIINTVSEPDENGFVPNQRLSGLLPFLACYVTSTPARNNIFLGEDRNDVMGGHKTPGHRRWDICMPSTQIISHELFNTYRNPKIRFSHRDGIIINEDRNDIEHASTTTTWQGRAAETIIYHNPRVECDEVEAQRQAEMAAQAPPPINTV